MRTGLSKYCAPFIPSTRVLRAPCMSSMPRAATIRFSRRVRWTMRTERIYPGSFGPVAPLYVWQYPLRLVHWGIVISIAVLSVTGYYIHDPYIVGQQNPFLMGWFRFVHEVFGMLFLSLFLLRVYLFFGGNKWEGWRQFIPLSKDRFREIWELVKFYGFIRPTPVSKIG